MELPLRRPSAVVAVISLAMGGCVTVPPPGYRPQALAISTQEVAPPRLGWGSAASGPGEELPGAECTASNDRGSWTVVTPGVLAVERSAAMLRIRCSKEGYREARLALPCAMPGSEAGIAFAFLGPLVVLPAVAIGTIVAANREGAEARICAYGAGNPVHVVMER